ncbi:MAG TPA: ATP-binding cassette domain-containing protein [Spirochaetota bacterium]|nr:ATP-binding cassette domain-containing protein [Spirochaetota bacterium]
MKRIMVQKLSYNYPDGTQALNDISFEVNGNQRVAVVGHNGSGKSTLLCILSALLLPTSGMVKINDNNLTHKNKILIRKSTGILFSQVEYQFIMPDIINDVMLSINNGDDEEKYLQAMDIIKQVNLADVAFHHPLSLSSGQMKRQH